MVKFNRENLTEKDIAEIDRLSIIHNTEVAPFPGAIVDVNWNRVSSEVNHYNTIHYYTAREGERLVGYAFYFIYNNIVYKHKVMAFNEVLFIHPDYRKGFMGYRFLKYLDDQLSKSGVNWIYNHVKAKKDFGKLFEKLGYDLIDHTYGREV